MQEAEKKHIIPSASAPFQVELIDLDAHPDGALLRLIAEGAKASEAYDLLTKRRYRKGMARADRAECSAAFQAVMRTETRIIGTPARTGLGALAKAMFTLEHRAVTDKPMNNLTWGIGGLMFSVISDAVRMGTFA